MNLRKRTIVAVDDDPLTLEILRVLLEGQYKVFTASSGEKLFHILDEVTPDLILLDIEMPNMNGYDIIKKLKVDSRFEDVPIIFLTSFRGESYELEGFELGAAEFVVKPFAGAVLLKRIAKQLDIFGKMKIMEQLSMTDQLTSISNRRYFDRQFEIEWGRAVRTGTSLCIMIADIDFFKKYNDTYGHLQGDTALKTVAQILHHIPTRSTDLVARFGGEEFVVVLPNTDTNEALRIAESMRAEVEKAAIPCEDGKITKHTISIGVHSMKPTRHDNPLDLLEKADKALYFAKEQGRNRVSTIEN